mmetsp:Transcript_113617/g.242561  ORF Transcript_113617/g.242561 Transcript_113617/m.242561 type:complete len:324 (+) Transcript_113617:102-1073(+)
MDGDAQRCAEIATQASSIENEAMELDRQGEVLESAAHYRRAAARLLEAVAAFPDNRLSRLMEEHAKEVSTRADYLEGLGSEKATVPLEQHIHCVQVQLEGTSGHSAVTTSVGSRGPISEGNLMGAAAVLGGAVGFFVLGPISAGAIGVAAAYATTREDKAGLAARGLGVAGLRMADKARDINENLARVLAGERPQAVQAPPGRAPSKKSASLEQCSAEARRLLSRYPDRIPVVCEKAARADLPDIGNKKFAVPHNMLCSEFKYIVHKQINQAASANVAADQTIYLFVNGISPRTTASMLELHEQYKAADGFLYVAYTAENTLG